MNYSKQRKFLVQNRKKNQVRLLNKSTFRKNHYSFINVWVQFNSLQIFSWNSQHIGLSDFIGESNIFLKKYFAYTGVGPTLDIILKYL